MRPRKSFHKRPLSWWLILATIASAALGWYVLTRVLVIRGTIVFADPGHEYEIWLDGNPADLTSTPDGWLFKAGPGRHTLTLQNQARQESKLLITVRSGRTITVAPPAVGQASSDGQAAFVGSASYVRVSTDGKYLYYLNREGSIMRRYNVETGTSVALSDAVFKAPTQISFSPDESTISVRSGAGNWYGFDFRKTDFINNRFVPLADRRTISLAFDPSRFRFGYIRSELSSGRLALYTAEADMSQPHLETELAEARSPRLIWAPTGLQIALLDDASYNKSNLRLYDLARAEMRVIPVENVTDASFSPDGRWLLVEQSRGTERWLQIVDAAANQATEIGRLRQAGLAAWRPTESVVWAVLNDSDGLTVTAINPDGSRQTVGQVGSLPGIWQRLLPMADSSDLLIQSSFDVWRVPLLKP